VSGEGLKSRVNVDAAANATGTGQVVSKGESARSTVDSAGATAANPGGAARAQVDSQVSGAMGQAPVDPAATQAKADFAQKAVNNPSGAAADQVHGGVQTSSSSSGASVHVEAGVNTPSTDPKK
jgi:hypothetical protein